MSLKIGEVYRYSSKSDSKKLPDRVADGLPNFFYETYSDIAKSTVRFQMGIHNIKSVKGADGQTRIPAIIISSSPHKARTDTTPWEDDFDPDFGRIRYFGDNKSPDVPADQAKGNSLLLREFYNYSSPDMNVRRLKGTPLIFFKRVEFDGRKKGNLLFQGFGIIESVELITQFDPKLTAPYFTNYVFNMCVFSLTEDNEEFCWDWINARRNPEYTIAQTETFAPKSWRKWVKEGSASLHKVRRNISASKVISVNEQKPEVGSKEEKILYEIYTYYQDKKHVFELLAMRVAQEVFLESGVSFVPGWITQKSSDRGIDFVGRIDISSQMSALRVIVLGQAKCEDPKTPTNGLHIARTVARLKRGWFGVFVTTSYYSRNVQLEVIDDQYPIMLICGKKLAEAVERILFKKGISLKDFLVNLDEEYKSENKRPEDILCG